MGLAELFVEMVRVARDIGLVTLGATAVVAAKAKVNLCRHKAMSYACSAKSECKLAAQIDVLMMHATANDDTERKEPVGDLPAKLRSARRGRWRPRLRANNWCNASAR